MLVAIYKTVNLVLNIFEIVLIARILISWLPVSRNNKLIDLLYAVTEPVLAPIRNMLSRSSFMNNSMFSMIDFSPIVAFILIGVLRSLLLMILRMFL